MCYVKFQFNNSTNVCTFEDFDDAMAFLSMLAKASECQSAVLMDE